MVVELDARVLENEVHLGVWIGEVGKKREVPVEVRGGVEVYAVEACAGDVEHGGPRLDHEEDNEGDDAGKD